MPCKQVLDDTDQLPGLFEMLSIEAKDARRTLETKSVRSTGTVFLMYHELGIPGRKCISPLSRRYVVRESDFREQVQQLKVHHWRGLSISEALVDLNRKGGVAFTFDDGCESDFIAAAPILKEANFSATFYVVVGWLGKPGYLSIRQLHELQAMGFEIGCHSMTHVNLTELGPIHLNVEIADAKTKLEDILGRRVDHFSAPSGYWNRKLADLVRQAGYCSATTSGAGTNTSGTDLFGLHRVVILRNTPLTEFLNFSMGSGLLARRARQSLLRIPKSLFGYSKYLQLVSFFMQGDSDEALETPRNTSRPSTMPPVPNNALSKAVVVDYNLAYGGNAYERMVVEALSSELQVSRITIDFRKWGPLKYVAAPGVLARVRRNLKHLPQQSLVVKTFLAGLLDTEEMPTIIMLHHIGSAVNFLFGAVEQRIMRRLSKFAAVVVVSEYWRQYLVSRGLTNVFTIYNAFKLDEFAISPAEIDDFKQRYNLTGKPIVYLGNFGPAKGVEEAFHALDDLDVHLVASGVAPARHQFIPVLALTRHDYLCLLAASTLAVTMSQFSEGWCRTAHEAMLCHTPVLGSGQGGMGELLTGGGQIVCRDLRSLRESAEMLLGSPQLRADLANSGYEFARQFTFEKFQADWLELAHKVHQRAAVVVPAASAAEPVVNI
jgi:glycosyltransferase involved in cell wall biosynthesis